MTIGKHGSVRSDALNSILPGDLPPHASVPVPTKKDAAGYHYTASNTEAEYWMPGGAHPPGGHAPKRPSGLYFTFNLPEGAEPKAKVTLDVKNANLLTITVDGIAKAQVKSTKTKAFSFGPDKLPIVANGPTGPRTSGELVVVDAITKATLCRASYSMMPRP